MPRKQNPVAHRRGPNKSKIVKPDAKRVGDWVLAYFRKGGWSISAASKRLGIPNTTLSNTIKGYYLPSLKWIDRLAVLLTEIEQNFNPDAVITVDLISAQRTAGLTPEQIQAEGSGPPRKPDERPPARSFLHQFERLGPEGRREIFPEILYICSRDLAAEGKVKAAPISPASILWAEVEKAIDRMGAADAEDFAKQVFLGQGMLPAHRDFPVFLRAIAQVQGGIIPPPGDDEFAALDYLLGEIFNGQFEGDLSALSLHLSGLATDQTTGASPAALG